MNALIGIHPTPSSAKNGLSIDAQSLLHCALHAPTLLVDFQRGHLGRCSGRVQKILTARHAYTNTFINFNPTYAASGCAQGLLHGAHFGVQLRQRPLHSAAGLLNVLSESDRLAKSEIILNAYAKREIILNTYAKRERER